MKTPAKRTSIISFLVAFVLIASFMAALLPITISPRIAQAETVQFANTSVGTSYWTVPTGVTSVTVLVVAGGGGGGSTPNLAYNSGGGGGGGGVTYCASYTVIPGTSITIVVGGGGNPASNGNPSSFNSSLSATGGGRGGSAGTGSDGGSGGGGGTTVTTEYNGGDADYISPRQGYDGGRSWYSCCTHYGAGGGGGAGAVGSEGSTSNGGNGGAGVDYSSIFGTGVGASGWFSGGGGGGDHATGGSATAGGASGASGNGNGNSVTVANSGGGGGGAYCTGIGAKTGGSGGSGVVIVKYTTYTVTYTAGSGGTVNGSWPQTVTSGSNGPWVQATANSCYHFVNWSDSSTTNPRRETNVTSDLSYTANFAVDVKTVTYSAGTGGTVNGSWPQNVNCGSDGPWVLASPDPSYAFVNWSDSSTTNPRHETNVTSNLSYTANFALSNSAPTIGTVALWTTGGSPEETTSMSPQVEYNIKIPVTDSDTFSDLATLKATLYYDSDGSYSEGEVPTSGNIQTCAILTWTKATNTLTIDSGGSSTWSVNNASSVFPSLSNTSGTFEFHFTPGKVATYTTGAAKWHIYVKATDSVSNTGTGTKQNLTMNWYSEVIVNTDTVNWGDVDAGLTFGEGDPSEETVSVTYICNGAYNEQVQASTTWTGSPSGSSTLDTGGTPNANEFSLKADDDGTLTDAIIVSGSYQTFDTGTITSESGNTETSNSLWLSIGTPFTKATYSGTIYYQIAQ